MKFYQSDMKKKIDEIETGCDICLSVERKPDLDIDNWGLFLVKTKTPGSDYYIIWQGSYQSCMTFISGMWAMSRIKK